MALSDTRCAGIPNLTRSPGVCTENMNLASLTLFQISNRRASNETAYVTRLRPQPAEQQKAWKPVPPSLFNPRRHEEREAEDHPSALCSTSYSSKQIHPSRPYLSG